MHIYIYIYLKHGMLQVLVHINRRFWLSIAPPPLRFDPPCRPAVDNLADSHGRVGRGGWGCRAASNLRRDLRPFRRGGLAPQLASGPQPRAQGGLARHGYCSATGAFAQPSRQRASGHVVSPWPFALSGPYRPRGGSARAAPTHAPQVRSGAGCSCVVWSTRCRAPLAAAAAPSRPRSATQPRPTVLR